MISEQYHSDHIFIIIQSIDSISRTENYKKKKIQTVKTTMDAGQLTSNGGSGRVGSVWFDFLIVRFLFFKRWTFIYIFIFTGTNIMVPVWNYFMLMTASKCHQRLLKLHVPLSHMKLIVLVAVNIHYFMFIAYSVELKDAIVQRCETFQLITYSIIWQWLCKILFVCRYIH